MNTKIKALSIFLFIIYVSAVCHSIYSEYDYQLFDFKSGQTAAREQAGNNKVESRGITHIRVKTKKESLFLPGKEINSLSGEEIEYAASSIYIPRKKPNNTCLVIGNLLCIPTIIILIYIPLLFFQLIKAILKDSILNNVVVRKIRRLSLLFILFSLTDSLVYLLLEFLPVYNTVAFKDYELVFNWNSGFWFFVIGLILLLIAEILKVSLRLKEEQELTI